MLVLLGFLAVLTPITIILNFSLREVVSTLIAFPIYSYSFAVIFSLYIIFKNEHGHQGVYYSEPGAKV